MRGSHVAAPRLYMEGETAPHAASNQVPDSAIERMLEALQPASVVYLARFPADSRPLTASSAPRFQSLLSSLAPEPCHFDVILAGPLTLAIVLTPKSGRPLDPMEVHALLALFEKGLATETGLKTDGDFGPTLLPLAPVASVDGLQENLSALNELLETILNRQMRVQFQPIVHFGMGQTFGYESLIRMPQTGNLKRAGMYFHAADRARLVSWLDVACQELCFETAARAGVRDHLFINMDAEGLAHLHLAEQSLAKRAAEFNIAPSRVVLEITERQAVDDFPRLTQYIEQLREEGFKIAIDDAGAGYSSLHSIAELRPDFVKIDRSLVRTIENSPTRRALLSTLTHYAHQIGAQVIAEGLETRDELATVIEMGVPYGQGYLLGKPDDKFKSLRQEMQVFIGVHLERRRNRVMGREYAIEKMARYGVTVPASAPCSEVARKFRKMEDLESVVVVAQDGGIDGLIMRDRFRDEFREGVPEAETRTAADIMDRQPLVVEADTALEDVAQRATYRRSMRFHDDIVVGRAGMYVGVVPVRALMEALSTRHVNRLKYAHPLTGLPGPALIEATCDERLQGERPTAVLHVGMAHFRAFNDHFGLSLGDEALMAAARVLEQNLMIHGTPEDFVGHLSGDDFIVLIAPEQSARYCAACIAEFDVIAPHFYTPEQNRVGGLETTNGGMKTPFMYLRIAGVSTPKRTLYHFRQAMQILRSVRRAAINEPDKRFVLD
jgi:EAL domain-containing protein (putative c-di-GMP-specific phosphodiesterase class I)/GGDEF domain-containing protein